MQKKEVYDYLAETYLSNYKRRVAPLHKNHNNIKRNLTFMSFIIMAFGIISILFYSYRPAIKINKKQTNTINPYNIIPADQIIRIKYNFGNPSKDSSTIYTIGLNSFDLKQYTSLNFKARKAKERGSLDLRILFKNSKNQSADSYITEVRRYWKEYSIDLSQIRRLIDLSSINGISFIIEKGNLKVPEDIVYIDSIRFMN